MVAFVSLETGKVVFWLDEPTDYDWVMMSTQLSARLGYPVYIA